MKIKNKHPFIIASILCFLLSISSHLNAQAGAALNFDGTNDYVTTSQALISGQVQATFEAWVKPTLRSDGTALTNFPNNVISTDVPGSYGRGFGVNLTSSASGIVLEYHNGFRYINYSFTSGTWYHVAVVYTSSNIKTYVDGSVIDNVNVSNNATNAVVVIGKHNDDGAYGTRRFFNGALDDIRIWNTARTCDQISQLRNCELVGNETGLVAYYKCNQGTAAGDNTTVTSLTDATANAYNGTFSGFALNGSTSNFIATGGVTTGVSCGAVVAPEINLKGNSNDITYGSTTPSATNHTNFGTVTSGGSLVRTFTIENLGAATLNINSISSNNAKFLPSDVPPSVPASSTATFTVTFSPTGVSVENATITVNSNDCDEPTYTFAVTGTGSAVLSAELLTFKGQYTDPKDSFGKGGSVLTWATAHEENINQFEVESSLNGVLFEKIGEVKAKGSNAAYTFLDANPSTQTYYRLKMVDVATNKVDYSKIISIESKSSTKVKIYPSVTNGELTVEGATSFEVVNTIGQIQKSQHGVIRYLNLDLPNGLYIIRGVDTEGVAFSQKIIKQ
ncbi:MAG: choice-of-anchor D domain-containing protein [Saprospiraceae bacterium]|nr:choice-of-anchor D domain-containing protein [Saprospiraceae bacterium]